MDAHPFDRLRVVTATDLAAGMMLPKFGGRSSTPSHVGDAHELLDRAELAQKLRGRNVVDLTEARFLFAVEYYDRAEAQATITTKTVREGLMDVTYLGYVFGEAFDHNADDVQAALKSFRNHDHWNGDANERRMVYQREMADGRVTVFRVLEAL